MLTRSIVSLAARSFSTSIPAVQKTADPIQKLFLDKIKEYDQKSKAAGGKLIEASPDIERELKNELDKIRRIYGADSADLTKFPTFNFEEPAIDPINLQK